MTDRSPIHDLQRDQPADLLEELYTAVYFIFPDQNKQRAHLADLFVYLINSIPSCYTAHVFVRNQHAFVARYSSRLTRPVQVIELPFHDIWLGDFFPYRLDADNLYTFQYGDGEPDRRTLLGYLENVIEEPIHRVPLYVDLGAFEIVGDSLLISTGVYIQNARHLDRQAVNEILTAYFEPATILVFDPGTVLNHLDVMFRVFDDIILYNPVLVSDKQLQMMKQTEIGPLFHFYPVPFALPGDRSSDGDEVDSYLGCPFCFLVLGDYILYPITSDQDRIHLQALRALLRTEGNAKTIIELNHPDMQELYAHGGGLFCVAGVY